jgi:hypothetical protein
MADFGGFSVEIQTPEVLFEAAAYKPLRNQTDIRASRLLYSRTPVQRLGPLHDVPFDIVGRHLFVFERAEGVNNIWEDLSADDKVRFQALKILSF